MLAAGEMMQTIAANAATKSRAMIACGSSNGNVYLWDMKASSFALSPWASLNQFSFLGNLYPDT